MLFFCCEIAIEKKNTQNATIKHQKNDTKYKTKKPKKKKTNGFKGKLNGDLRKMGVNLVPSTFALFLDWHKHHFQAKKTSELSINTTFLRKKLLFFILFFIFCF